MHNDRVEDAVTESVLVVDDEQAMRSMLRNLLEGKAYHVVEAGSGEQALKVLNETFVDIVITDLKMPGMDGLALAQRLLQADPDRPVLLMTAYADVDSARRAVGMGIYEYFTKPFDVNDMLAGVHRALEHRRLVLENLEYQKDLEWKVKERTRELQRASVELIRAERMSAVGRLAAGVVHEVLNPLSAAVGRIDMVLREGGSVEQHRRSLGIAQEQLLRAVEMMDNLRDFSRQRPPKRERVHLNALIPHVLDLVVHETRRHAVEVHTQFGRHPSVLADPDQLAQVFLNLANNAIDAMPGGGRLTVETRTVEDGGELAVEICFTDTGTGIAQADLSRIFEPFYTTKKDGTGLGLPICKGIVEAHGGRIEVNSRQGEGTTFAVRLPVEG